MKKKLYGMMNNNMANENDNSNFKKNVNENKPITKPSDTKGEKENLVFTPRIEKNSVQDDEKVWLPEQTLTASKRGKSTK